MLMTSVFRRLFAAALIGFASLASAADYPSKPIRIIVPYQAGGSTDAVSRMVGQKLSEKLGQPVLIENRPGASEQIAAGALKQSAADGHTLMLATTVGLAVNPSLYSKLTYDPQKDLAPVILAVNIPSVVVVNPKVPVRNMDELTAYIKANPGKVSYGSAGNGAPSHLAMELYKRASNVEVTHVAYKGGAPALQDLMAGNIHVMIALVPEAMPLVKAGKLKALAITSPARSALYPELPPVSETPGMKNFEIYLWYSFVASAGTPKDVLDKLNQTINGVLADKDVNEKLTEMGMEVAGGPISRLSTLARSETAKWKKVIDDAGIKAD
jgi:tripartite-type tricarboxylate transporter receptor subunit TctC